MELDRVNFQATNLDFLKSEEVAHNNFWCGFNEGKFIDNGKKKNIEHIGEINRNEQFLL